MNVLCTREKELGNWIRSVGEWDITIYVFGKGVKLVRDTKEHRVRCFTSPS